MKSTLNHACISALLSGAVLVAIPAFAQNADAGANANAGADAATTSNDTTNAAADNNAGGMKMATHHKAKKAQHASNAAEVETTRQLNQEAAANAKATTTAH
jgi:hypothetical protein